MTNEQLRMQFIGGIITESEYKVKLRENEDNDFIKSEMERLISKVSNNPEIQEEEKIQRINDIKFVIYDFLDPETRGGKRPPIGFKFDDRWWSSVKSLDPIVYQDALSELLSAARGSDSFSIDEKQDLNENIVSIGAINNPFPTRKKSDYELAFEYFTKGGLNEEMDSMNSGIESYLLGLFDSIDLGDEYQEGPQTYTFEKIEWADEDLYGEEAEMFAPAHSQISSKGSLTITDPNSGTPVTFSTEGEDIVASFNTEDFPGL